MANQREMYEEVSLISVPLHHPFMFKKGGEVFRRDNHQQRKWTTSTGGIITAYDHTIVWVNNYE